MGKRGTLIFLLLLAAVASSAQRATPVDSTAKDSFAVAEVVITGTRSEQALARQPLHISVVPRTQILASGSMRLQDILGEQTGLVLTSPDIGTDKRSFGLQLQGLSADYVLVLLDGEPVVGRSAGTLDLNRLSARNVQRIEILRGPASSLYGSEALGGVVNIITDKPSRARDIQLYARYGSNNTADLSANGQFVLGRVQLLLGANHYRTDGYTLQPQSGSPTVAPQTSYNYTLGLVYTPGLRTVLGLRTRWYNEYSRTYFPLTDNSANFLDNIQAYGRVQDWNLNPYLTRLWSEQHKTQLRLYASNYRIENLRYFERSGVAYDTDFFQQSFYRAEAQHTWQPTRMHGITLGGGYYNEGVNSTRYTSGKSTHAYYVYGQYDLKFSDIANLVVGARYDAHAWYKPQLSPKASLQVRVLPGFTANASVGVGFKAPDFRQLFLNFTNPLGGGYSVLGSEELASGIAFFEGLGRMLTFTMPPDQLGRLRAESSFAYNLLLRYTPVGKWGGTLNLFRNQLTDLIEVQRVAVVNDPANPGISNDLFSYRNLNRVVTQGAELDLHYKATQHLTLHLGYQYLDSYDADKLQAIRDGQVFTRDAQTLGSRRVSETEYGGLFGRARHSANLKAFYQHKKIEANIRLIYRGRYGYADRDGNQVLDDGDPYVEGYLLCNLALAYNTPRWRLQLGCDNLTGHTAPQYLPMLPGRLLYAALQFNVFPTNN